MGPLPLLLLKRAAALKVEGSWKDRATRDPTKSAKFSIMTSQGCREQPPRGESAGAGSSAEHQAGAQPVDRFSNQDNNIMLNRVSRFLLPGLAALAAIVAFGGCGGSGSSNNSGSAAKPPPYQGLPINGIVITKIVPNSGPLAGATIVNITGSGFSSGPLTVYIGSVLVPSPSVTVFSNTTMSIVTPGETVAGTFDIRIVNPAGVSPAAAADQFTYIVPTGTGGGGGTSGNATNYKWAASFGLKTSTATLNAIVGMGMDSSEHLWVLDNGAGARIWESDESGNVIKEFAPAISGTPLGIAVDQAASPDLFVAYTTGSGQLFVSELSATGAIEGTTPTTVGSGFAGIGVSDGFVDAGGFTPSTVQYVPYVALNAGTVPTLTTTGGPEIVEWADGVNLFPRVAEDAFADEAEPLDPTLIYTGLGVSPKDAVYTTTNNGLINAIDMIEGTAVTSFTSGANVQSPNLPLSDGNIFVVDIGAAPTVGHKDTVTGDQVANIGDPSGPGLLNHARVNVVDPDTGDVFIGDLQPSSTNTGRIMVFVPQNTSTGTSTGGPPPPPNSNVKRS
jgi:hypothetical protein